MSTDRIDEHGLQSIAEMEREHALEIRLVRDLQAALAAGEQATYPVAYLAVLLHRFRVRFLLPLALLGRY